MAPPRGSLCRTLWFGTVIAVLTLLFLCSYDSVPVPTTLRLYAHGARRATTVEQLLYREEERYGKVVAMREELVLQAGVDETRSVPNRTTLQQLYPASFHCPYPLTLVGTSWICDLERIADSGRCGVYTVGPRDDLFTTSFLQAAPGCRTTTYTPGPQKFGNGRVYTSASGGWQTGGRGWIGISPVAEWPTPAPMGEPKLVQQPRGCGGDPLCEQKSGSGYTLEQLLRRSSHARNVDVLRIDLPFDEMVSALASLPMPTSSAEDIDSWVLPVGQLILGLRPSESNISTHDFRAWWESLERVGLRPFAVHDREDEVLEYSFLNLRALQLFTPSSRLS